MNGFEKADVFEGGLNANLTTDFQQITVALRQAFKVAVTHGRGRNYVGCPYACTQFKTALGFI